MERPDRTGSLSSSRHSLPLSRNVAEQRMHETDGSALQVNSVYNQKLQLGAELRANARLEGNAGFFSGGRRSSTCTYWPRAASPSLLSQEQPLSQRVGLNTKTDNNVARRSPTGGDQLNERDGHPPLSELSMSLGMSTQQRSQLAPEEPVDKVNAPNAP
ncbi:hypothetical protein EYF80_036756 [Liparis tanakae]|uniref:Uncharacterized protein n=1 Tax=Liparis tanakae TaxID=230148 RepID=A0A4Z2GJK7_9TELE|nr:hypothetical protein EYF80_036756 [Liparis tanakae]